MDRSELDWFDNFQQTQAAEVLAAVECCRKNGDYELTDEQRFAIAYLSGAVKIDWTCKGKKINAVTEECGIVWNGEQFLVATKQDK